MIFSPKGTERTLWMRFDGKTVIVTGAGVGIGRATAVAFASAGANVVVNCLSEKNGNETLSQVLATGAQGILSLGDVGKENEAQAIVESAVKAFGRLDVLVNNAGVVIPGTIETATAEGVAESLRVNAMGTFLMSHYAVEHLKATKGCIVNNASVSALKGSKNRVAYAASKGAVVSMTRAMAVDLLPYGIRVNCICPGMTMTPSLEQRIENSGDPNVVENYLNAIPIHRFAQPEEIANAILFAAWEEAGFMNGSVIPVDGGKSM